MNKIFLVLVVLIAFTSCNKAYNVYEVVNNTSEQIFVEILTYGGEYQKTLSYTINPVERCEIFEHPKTEDNETLSKYIKQINIRYGDDRTTLEKEFIYGNFKLRQEKGALGNYSVYEFAIEEKDLE
ncbi:MAG: hypothetical protein R6T91_08340 [Bacteroidales bacterium]